MTLKPHTFEALLAFTNRVLAIVRCDAAEIQDRGSRSEQVWIDATVLQPGLGNPPATWRIHCYTQGDPKMKKASTYLAAAYEEAPGEWYLEECLAVAPDTAAAALKAAVDSLKEKTAAQGKQP